MAGDEDDDSSGDSDPFSDDPFSNDLGESSGQARVEIEGSSRIPPEVVEALAEHFARGGRGSRRGSFAGSEEELRSTTQLAWSLEELASTIRRHQPEKATQEFNLVWSALSEKGDSGLAEISESCSFFPSTFALLRAFFSPVLESYALLEKDIYSSISENKLRGKFTEPALMETKQLANTAVHTYLSMCVQVPKILAHIYEHVKNLNAHLQDRFDNSKPAANSLEEPGMMMVMHDPGEIARRKKYVKVELIDGNPVLTDVLLNLAEALPNYQRSGAEEKSGGSGTRKVNPSAIKRAARELVATADPLFLSYLEQPEKYLEDLAHFGGIFGDLFADTESTNIEIGKHPLMQGVVQPPQLAMFFDHPTYRSIDRALAKIESADLDRVVQHPEDYVPDNRREADLFRVREKLLRHLHSTMQRLSRWDDSEIEVTTDRESKYDFAEKAVLEAVELKSEMRDIALEGEKERVHTNKISGKEYYVGKQEGMGRFAFERAPAPEVRMEDVIGASFDAAKKHLGKVIDLATLQLVMSLTAPDGKIRSNMLIIGSYGCGKTELAKAACADPRVMGASVSLRNILTALAHESPNNLGRVYDEARKILQEGREMMPLLLVIDEFDGLFKRPNQKEGIVLGGHDLEQIELVLSEMLDGMGDYRGITTIAMTNQPEDIPPRIMRRFRYVDVVGQLTTEERAGMAKRYLAKLPLHETIGEANYAAWGERLKDAPGDVVRKVFDEVHWELMGRLWNNHPEELRLINGTLQEWKKDSSGYSEEIARGYLLEELKSLGGLVYPDEVTRELEATLSRPENVEQIQLAKETYLSAEKIKQRLTASQGQEERPKFGLPLREGGRAKYFHNT